MKRQNRLTRTVDYKRVRESGKSFSHPFAVLVYTQNDQEITRFGVSASKRVGNAVERNRAKRRIRAVCDTQLQNIVMGWDVVIFARHKINQADHQELSDAIEGLFKKAGLMIAAKV
ncbi:MAG: ribonuclease P protein component [Anaerolineaceae bacterium]|nr:ribonuclease P protein component [Anaerolineaceae bacterium]